jgi:hypothetical protein
LINIAYRLAIAIDRADGKIKWQRTLHEAIPHERPPVSSSLLPLCRSSLANMFLPTLDPLVFVAWIWKATWSGKIFYRRLG